MPGPVADYDAYAALYDAHTVGVPGDVEFYGELAREAEGPIVEIGVGTARIALPIAQAGVTVIGLDRSPAMLRIAREKARAAGVTDRLALVQADMRRWSLRTPVALVTIPFRTFLHNLTTDDQLATLAAARAALIPGGRLALNVFNPNITQIAGALGREPDAWERRRGPGDVEQRLEYEPTAQIARTTWVLRRRGGRRVRFSFALRYVYRYEMEHLLARAGFELEALYGDHERRAFHENATELVWVARKPSEGGS